MSTVLLNGTTYDSADFTAGGYGYVTKFPTPIFTDMIAELNARFIAGFTTITTMATSSILGRVTAGSGAVEVLSVASVRTLLGCGLLSGGNTWSGNQNFGSGTLTTTGAVSTGLLTVSSTGASNKLELVRSGYTYENALHFYTGSTLNWSVGTAIVDTTGTLDILYDGTTNVMRFLTTGVISMPHYGAGTATFDASGNISSVSDERMKIIKGKYKSGLKELNGVEPILHKWNKKSGMETKGTYAGFSAQNVKKNIPYGTGENNEGYLSLQDRAILATLVNSVNELHGEVKKLRRGK